MFVKENISFISDGYRSLIQLIEDFAARFWDVDIFDGPTMMTVTVYELHPDPDATYRLRYDQIFDVFTEEVCVRFRWLYMVCHLCTCVTTVKRNVCP